MTPAERREPLLRHRARRRLVAVLRHVLRESVALQDDRHVGVTRHHHRAPLVTQVIVMRPQNDRRRQRHRDVRQHRLMASNT